jgi:hypothetical protein
MPRRDPGRGGRDPRGVDPWGRDPQQVAAQRAMAQQVAAQQVAAQQVAAQRAMAQPGGRRDGAAREAGGPRDARGRKARRKARRPPGRWGALQGGLGVCIVVASAAVGTIATMVTRSTPGLLLGFFVVIGTVAAALAVRPRAGWMILPVPVLSYLVAALTSGIVHSQPAGLSTTALVVGAAQWVALGFFAMALATVLAVAITTARWYLWRRRRPARLDRGRPGPASAAAPPGTWPVGRPAPPSAAWGAPPGGFGDWGDASSRGGGRRPGPRQGTGPYNFSSGA